MKLSFEKLRAQIEGKVIVSAQAPDGHALRDTHALTAIAKACVDGGSPAIRCGGYGGVEDIASISNAVEVPIFGLTKEGTEGIYITPTRESVRAVARAGAAVVCADATFRKRPDGSTVADLIEVAHEEDILFMADCATADQAKAAADAGADIVSTTLAGYTEDRPKTDGPDFELLKQTRELIGPDVFLIGEGRFSSPADAAKGLELGANAIIVGTAITDPGCITAQFQAGVSKED
ncbi:putative N-acetylmannosamine-6-phosphate 2-epimerase [Corynebacterium ammoniagenes]|uniref:N-acylglucosamine-6-phosphate 2-epimerase n=2 Tax=Corynebacterium ammoniagenes TaxID=1697 RepID=A0AAV5GBF3_CORAM|nr:putative N-acetylmannosamine-6-phosphate 2-epimerase [Corynebacterium ammoniagenes]APT83299.1 N-acetylmannosamine-6-phosphate 2-epimerase [Corynebacterium ammoniagenes DSM 20306]AQS74315.1 N-acetylmannosamine-6-phosphate 2-epimerase [Corynebacterium ammoniagenes]EFG81456.1 putative N-acetylmannosamine-6-phosphate epimerase [Corynebacterium ammoniagenes DSM 20306]GJN43600.1 putative N-acetylmannosamine-6-phosphate 2-epimerase [Corynebacterium ammoniagenes]